MTYRSLILIGVLVSGLAAGCHELQPHRLQRLNRGPGLSTEAYYSVPDPPPASEASQADSAAGPQPTRE